MSGNERSPFILHRFCQQHCSGNHCTCVPGRTNAKHNADGGPPPRAYAQEIADQYGLEVRKP